MAALTEHGKTYSGYGFTLWTDMETDRTYATFDPATGLATLSDEKAGDIVVRATGRESEDYVRRVLRESGHTIIGLG